MKLLTSRQIREADAYTIKNEPIPSVDLMERAASKCTEWIFERFGTDTVLFVYTGPGNNGGDGLAIARLLSNKGYKVKVYQLSVNKELSPDSTINLNRLKEETQVEVFQIQNNNDFPKSIKNTLIIDALFGSGLARPISGLAKELVTHINLSPSSKIAIDIPSGLFSESNANNDKEAIIFADHTLTFQVPKLSFFFAKNASYIGSWHVLDINLNTAFIESSPSDYYYITPDIVQQSINKRDKFSHKGTYGHALLFAGSYGKMGAAVLSTKACIKSGCGLITVHLPSKGVGILQTAVPEAMLSIDKVGNYIATIPDIKKYNAIGIGPGIGTLAATRRIMRRILRRTKQPLVIDADGLNIISRRKFLLNKLPQNSVLTPHPKEFERLAGNVPDDFELYNFLTSFAKQYKCYIIYKEAYTKIACPDGKLIINPTGNPGMATAGSGDTLTGIVLSFLAQGYPVQTACIIATYLHGLAGDIFVEQNAQESLIASDLIEYLNYAFKNLLQ